MGNVPRLVEKKVFGVEDRGKSIFVDKGPSPGRQEACFNLGWEHAEQSYKNDDAISNGINIGVLGCNTKPYSKSYSDGYNFGNGKK